jgi:hypothetical protein
VYNSNRAEYSDDSIKRAYKNQKIGDKIIRKVAELVDRKSILVAVPTIDEAMDLAIPIEKEEIVVKTKLSMPSRKLKVKISSELLQELDKMQVSFKLN